MKLCALLLASLLPLSLAQFPFSSNVKPKVPSPSLSSFDPTNISSRLSGLLQQEWSSFAKSFGKTYSSPEEEKKRQNIFVDNFNKIQALNKDLGFAQAANKFSDLVSDEFNKLVNGFNNALRSKINILPPLSTFKADPAQQIPEHVDWREKGGVSSVKNQGYCACCWAITTAGALEGHNFRKNGRLVELSSQNLIDCSTNKGNEGCNGGLIEPAYEYIRDNKGINQEGSYGYEGKNAKCRYQNQDAAALCSGYEAIPIGDEKSLEAAVAQKGPVAVAIDASLPSFQFYKEGVYFDPKCSNKAEELNHAVLVVGYGKEKDGKKYWIVKNSYGSDWGMGGYVKMAKDANNHCGIATQATYPVV